MYRLSGNEIKEVWYVRAKISRFKHTQTQTDSLAIQQEIQAYKQTIQAQADILNLMQKQLHPEG